MQKSLLHYHNISDLSDFHIYINNIFLEHQIAIMNGELENAYTHLRFLSKLIKRHISDEEELLIPVYEKLISPEPPGGAIRYYLREHKQILRILNKLVSNLKEWLTNPPGQIDIVRQFDSYYKFKELLDHHDSRERVFLYRLLDQKLSPKEKYVILDKIRMNPEDLNV
jgi:hemerythrin-like domain-containing protein